MLRVDKCTAAAAGFAVRDPFGIYLHLQFSRIPPNVMALKRTEPNRPDDTRDVGGLVSAEPRGGQRLFVRLSQQR